MKQLHPGTKWSFRIGVYVLMFFLSLFGGWFVIPFFVAIIGIAFGASAITGIIIGVLISIFVYIIFTIILAEIYANLSYKYWLYEFGEDHLKIERGIIWKKYSNIPYERVQNVDITRGIIARMCGFSTVNIQTAGYSYNPNGGAFSEGYIPGVEMQEAEKIREFLMNKITKKGRSQGL
jgi:membrane protein YdbS with pleckstrin-like domain